MLDTIQRKIADRQSIDAAEAGWLFQHATDEQLQHLASQVRARFHAPDEATYLIMAIINYTNVCVARCDYCSFYRFPGDADTYLLTTEQVCEKIDALEQLGGQLVGFNGGFHPNLRVSDYIELFTEVRRRYPHLEFYEMTVAEFMFVSKRSKLSYAESARQFAAAGTRWITGGGAEILTNSFRMRHSPGKYEAEDYYAAQQAILEAGMGSTATMVIGFDETLDERLEHLQTLRDFQSRTGTRLPSFLCWTYKPWHNDLGGHEISTEEYLRWLAVSRIFLDNIPHIRASVLTQNERALEGLTFGADDFDLPTEDEVTQKAGATVSHEFEQILGAAPTGIRCVQRQAWPVQNGLL
ncbi:MAG: radical SAM protein [Myxococcota bacterium]